MVLMIEVMTVLELAIDGNVDCEDNPEEDPFFVDGIYDVVVVVTGITDVVETDDVDNDAVDVGFVDVMEYGCCPWVVV